MLTGSSGSRQVVVEGAWREVESASLERGADAIAFDASDDGLVDQVEYFKEASHLRSIRVRVDERGQFALGVVGSHEICRESWWLGGFRGRVASSVPQFASNRLRSPSIASDGCSSVPSASICFALPQFASNAKVWEHGRAVEAECRIGAAG